MLLQPMSVLRGHEFLGITPLTFTGNSKYSSDFQSILNRSVQIAQLPLQILQQQDQTALTKKTELGNLQSVVTSLTTSVRALGTLASTQAIAASSSNSAAVAIQSTGASSPASYSVNSVTSLATAASETSVAGFADSSSIPVSTTGNFNLIVGSQQFTINLPAQSNNLVGLQNAINQSGAGVTASILTTGNGNYLSISSNTLGANTLQLTDLGSNSNFLTDNNQGTNAVFSLNGLTVTRTSNTVNDLIPGATLTLKGTTNANVSLSLASDPTQLASAIQSFTSSYNAVVDQIKTQSGTSAGSLEGDSVLLQLKSDMKQLTSFQGSGTVRNLSDLGIELNSDGSMTFDQTVFNSLSQTQIADAFQFFGSATTGFGGLSDTLAQVSDPLTGAIKTEIGTLDQTDSRLQTQISDMTTKINTMQNTLFQQLSKADAAISELSSQQSILTSSIESLDYVLYGKQVGS